MYDKIKQDAARMAEELIAAAKPEKGEIFVVGCSSSEIKGEHIGKGSDFNAAEAVFEGIYPVIRKHGLYLAAQCCEHLNRAIILEKEAALKYGLPPVNAVPQPKAGGSFATAAYKAFSAPVTVENVQGALGMDIGGTLIGMHLRPVAVPVRLSLNKIGEATLICARTRPKFVGGVRAVYNEELL